MNITLHGYPGVLLVTCLALLGIADLTVMTLGWAQDRFTLDLRHLGIHRRWDRPGAAVILLDGREGAINAVFRESDVGDIAIVIFEDAPPEWVPVMSMGPAPAVAREVEPA